jgi:hypothetical protein
MSLAPGTRLGAYEVVALIGAGGMGEVYRARDARLGRDVAIKVLPAAFSADADRLRRFEQEARAAAALNHPNILSVHDIGSHPSTGSGQGMPYVVSELLEGETLRARIGTLPVRKACEYAIQIARGLAAAHEKGIVHRDLKPENLFVTDDGRVKILDFGLAKLTQKDSPLVSGTNVPTIPLAEKTEAGMVLGTIGYMAPEQVRAQAVDHRSDLFAFGAILYEMLSGKRAFHGETTIDTMTSILKEDPPDLPAAERHIPPALSRIVDRCIEKSPGARFQSANDLAFALEGLSSQSDTGVGAPQIAPSRGLFRDARIAWAVAALLAIGLAASAFVFATRTQPAPQTIAFEVHAAATVAAQHFALSPLGTHLVGVAGSGPQATLWLRNMSRVDMQRIAGTDYPNFPFWSHNGRFVAFFSLGKLRTVDIFGGPPQAIADAPTGRGGSWNADNIIIYSPSDTGPLFRVPAAAGGDPVQLTELDSARQETGHWHPVFLRDGRHFLFLARSTKPENNAIYFASLDSKERTLVMPSTTKVLFASPDRILFARGNALMAQRFDAARGVPSGDPVQVVDRIVTNPGNGAAGFAVSATGMLAHRGGAGARSPDTVLTWFDRTGKALTTLGSRAGYRNPRISPDGTRVVVERSNDAASSVDLWLIDTARQSPTRFTFADANAAHTGPIWSPDSGRVAWQARSNAGEMPTIFQKAIGGAAKEEKVRQLPAASSIDDWAAMGILFHDGANPPRAPGLQVLPLDGSDPRTLGAARTMLTHARVSPEPDRRWIAYTTSDTGRPEVYLNSFPVPSEPIRVSLEGGLQPLWRRDGKELFFLAPDGMLMAVPVQLSERATVGAPVALFPTRVEFGGVIAPGVWHQYDVARDGRFLINTLAQDQSTPSTLPITVVVNWAAGLK